METAMDEILAILKDLHPDVDFMTCNTLIDNKIIDSYDIISIITGIQDEFDLVISPDKIIPENFNSAQAIWALVQKMQAEEDED